MNSQVRQVLTKLGIGIAIGIVAALVTGADVAGWFGLCWAGTGVVFCPNFATKVAKTLGALSSWGGPPAYAVGIIIGFLVGLLAGPIIGIYQLILAFTSGS